MNAMATLLASALLVTGQAAERPDPSGATAVKLSNFVVTLIYDVRVPAREPGVLIALDAKKGQVVQKDEILGRIDDSDAQIRKLIADSELAGATAQADSDANLMAAEITIGVAGEEYRGTLDIKSRVPNAVSDFEERRLKLTFDRAKYQRDVAKVEHEVSQLTRGAKSAQLQAVENEIKRRQIECPVNGVVVERYHNEGEWAQAGEPLYRVVHMDRLRVEGMLNANNFMPEEIAGSPVKVHVTTPQGIEEFDATIDFVSPVVDPSGEFLIHAEFDNPRKANGQWTVRPGSMPKSPSGSRATSRRATSSKCDFPPTETPPLTQNLDGHSR